MTPFEEKVYPLILKLRFKVTYARAGMVSSMPLLRRIFTLERNVLVLSITVLLVLIPLNAWFVVLPLYLEELGATTIDIGISYALLNIAWYALQFLGGLLADRYGRKMLIVLPTFTFVACYLAAGFARMWSIVALAIVMSNAISGLQGPSFVSMIAESVAERHRGMAFATFGFFVNLGLAAGPLIGAALIPIYGYRPLFYITGAICGFCGIARLILLHEPVQKASEEKARVIFPTIGKNLMWFLAGCSLFAMVSGLIMPLTALYAEKRLGLSFVEVELMFFAAQFAMCLSSVPCGKLIERVGSKYCLMATFLGVCSITIAWAYSPFPWVAIVMMAVSYIFYALYYVAYDSLISSLTVPQTRGATLGIAAIMIGSFTGIGSAIGSYLWESYDPALPFLVTGILGLPLAVLLSKIEALNQID